MVDRSMECDCPRPSTLSDHALTAEITRLATEERRATAALVAALAEFDSRHLYLPAGCSSLFTYCTRVLHLSEHAAYNRIEAARAARKFPVLLERLANGSLTLTAARLLAPHLTPTNHLELFNRARHKSKHDLEELVAALRPKPDAASLIRKLPTAASTSAFPVPQVSPLLVSGLSGAETAFQATGLGEHTPSQQSTPGHQAALRDLTAASRPAVVAPLAPERYKVQFTASRETYDKLRRAQDLLRHMVPNGDPAIIMDLALTLLVADLERRKAGAVNRPRNAAARSGPNLGGQTLPAPPPAPSKPSRRIPSAVRREVWIRDNGRCAYVRTAGRCEERGLLEFHHVVPYADGGETTAGNIELRCRGHNGFEAERWFGADTLPRRAT